MKSCSRALIAKPQPEPCFVGNCSLRRTRRGGFSSSINVAGQRGWMELQGEEGCSANTSGLAGKQEGWSKL